MALPGPGSAMPQPSRMTSATEGTVGAAKLARRLDDRREIGRVETGAADQGPVDVLLGHQLGRVAGLDRSAIDDPRPVRLGAGLAQHVADERDRLLGLLRRRGPSRTDRPDRLV